MTKFNTHNYVEVSTEGKAHEGRCQRSTDASIDEKHSEGLIMLMYKHGDPPLHPERTPAPAIKPRSVCKGAQKLQAIGLEEVCARSAREEGLPSEGKGSQTGIIGKRRQTRCSGLNDANLFTRLCVLGDVVYLKIPEISRLSRAGRPAAAAPGMPIGFIDFTARWRSGNNRYLISLRRAING